ncbi:hypothetical protein Scep_011791 [Stephania cephalantha]|uniref:Trichome birefringence-like N-terminal domain-containing protein n=1 Tax=Stephania cephalantha TaxID=152367 RepID=A0AAP0P671_9MAGN
MMRPCGGIFAVVFLMIIIITSKKLVSGVDGCDVFTGSWVFDKTYPLYDSSTCPFIEHEFNCQRNGRTDRLYEKYRWRPSRCNLTRFNGGDFLERMRGQKMMFVGDSLSKNQWESLICMLYHGAPQANFTLTRGDPLSTLTVPNFRWDYIQIGHKFYKDMSRLAAFEIALVTWARWVDSNIDPNKTKVFFQGISPSHYNGSEWNKPNVKTCLVEKEPIPGSRYAGGSPPALSVLKKVLKTLRKPVQLLDVTTLSQLRKDGHPSMYGFGGPKAMDCSHWCLPGVTDTWNQLLYNALIS